jgi:hypothetical protein
MRSLIPLHPIPIPFRLTRLDPPPPILIMFNDDIYPPTKDFVPLYVRQPCSLQIIQLVECSSPPPQQNQNKYTPSRISSSSSSYSDSQSDSSAYDSSSPSLSDDSSYCSSAEQDGSAPMPPSFTERDPSVDDTYRTRQRRVSLWRDAVYSKNDAALGSFFTLTSYPLPPSPFPLTALLMHRI